MRPRRVRALAWLVVALTASTGRGDDTPAASVPPQPDDVSIPIARERYERFRDHAATDDARFQRVEYTAQLVGGDLLKGSLSGSVRLDTASRAEVTAETRFVPFGDCNLALRSVRSKSGPLVHGTLPNGRRVLRVGTGDGDVRAQWSLRGRPVGDSVEFDVRVAPAVVSTLRIRLPRGRVLTTDTGVVRSDESAPNTWVVSLGTRSECRLRIASALPPARSVAAVVLGSRRVRMAVQPEGVRFRVDYDLNVVRGELGAFSVEVPEDATVESVTFADRTPLVWRRTNGGGDPPRIEATLPDALEGRVRTVSVVGTLPGEFGGEWAVPRFGLVPSVRQRTTRFLLGSDRVRVDVASSLEGRVVEANGLRRLAVPREGGDGEAWEFAVEEPDGRLRMAISSPELAVRGESVAVVRATAESWSLHAALRWRARSGRSFGLRFLVPRGWRVTDVALPGDGSPKVSWRVGTDRAGRRVVAVDLLSPLSPSTPRTLLVEARSDVARGARAVVRPVLQPMDVEIVDAYVLLSGPDEARPTVVTGPGSRIVRPEAASSARLELLDLLPLDAAGDVLGYETHGLPSGVLFVRGPAAEGSTADVRLRLRDGALVADYAIELEVGDEPTPVVWTQDGHPTEWTIVGHPMARVVVESDDAAPSREQRLRVDGARGRVELRASAEIASPGVVPLPVFADEGFRGLVQLEPDVEPSVVAEPNGSLSTREGEPGWSYTTATAVLAIDARAAATVVSAATLELWTTVAPATPITTEAIYATVPDGRSRWFEFAIPQGHEILSCRVNADLVAAEPSEFGWRVRLPDPSAAHEVAIRHRGLDVVAFPRGTVPTNAPTTTSTILDVDWNLAVSPRLVPVGANGARFDSEPLPPSWRTRMFGPLARAEPMPFPLRFETTDGEAATSRDSVPASIPADWPVFSLRVSGDAAAASVTISNPRGTAGIAWIVLVVCLLCGAWLRGRRQVGRSRFGLGFAMIVQAASWLVPTDLVVVCGGALAGTILCFVLPRALFRRAERVDTRAESMGEGSTLSFQRVGAGSLLLLMLVGGHATSDDPGLVTELAGVRIPADDSPIVYVEPDVLERIREFERSADGPATHLVTAAEYELVPVTSGPRLLARYRVVPLDGAETIRLELPLRNGNPAGPTPCLVDGRAVPIELGDDPATIVVTLDRERFDGDELEVVLTLRPAVTVAEATSTLRVAVPAIAESRLVVDVPPSITSVAFSGGAPVEARPGRRLARWIGPTTEWSASWSEVSLEPERGETTLDVVALARVARTTTRVTARTKLAVEGRSFESTSWTIPPEYTVVSVVAEGRVETRPTANGDSLVTVTPTEEAGELQVDFELVTGPGPNGDVVVPSLACLTPTSPWLGEVRRSPDRIGFTTGTGWTIESVSTEAGGSPSTLAVDAFTGGDEAWATPEAAHVLDEPQPLLVALASRTARRDARQRLDERVRRGESQWTYSADVDVTGAAVFEHVLRIPRGRVVESVSVVANEVERVRRWEVRGDRLHVHLDDRVAGPHRITANGWIPLDHARPFDLGGIDLEGASSDVVATTVWFDDSVSVVSDPDRPPPLPIPAPDDRDGEWTAIGVYSVDGSTDTELRPRLRVDPSPRRREVSSRTEFARMDEPGEPWLGTTTLHLSAATALVPIRVQLPDGTSLQRITVDEDRVRAFRAPGGANEFTLVDRGVGPGEIDVEFTFTMPAPEGDDWRPGTVRVTGESQRVRHELIVPDGWSAGETTVDGRAASLRVAVTAGRFWWLRRATRTTTAAWAVVEHHLDVGPEETRGTTHVWIGGRTDELVLAWSDDRVLRSVQVEGRTVDGELGDGTLTVPVSEAGSRASVRIDWTWRERPTTWWVSDAPLPTVENVAVDRTLVVLDGTSDPRAGSDLERLTEIDFALERIDGRLPASTETCPAGTLAEIGRRLDDVEERVEAGSDPDLLDQRRERIGELRHRLSELVVSKDAGGAKWVETEGVVRGRIAANGDRVRVGVTPFRPLLPTVAVLLVVGLWLLSSRRNLDGWTERLHAHGPIALCLTGLVWWLALHASVVGAVVAIIGLVGTALTPFRRSRGDRSEIVV